MNRHNWTFQEDNQLKIVVQTNGSEDWTKNAELLREISVTAMQKKRTGKQCRQRWYNHLDPNVLKSQWSTQQQIKLFQIHKIYGNKWKQLTKYLPGRTDNDIKNHFYSTLRRSLRRLNKYIGEKNSTSQMREIKPSVLTFIINHIYNRDVKENSNKLLIDSLKQLPELIFKFSSFKPIKQNMDKKIDDNVKDKIVSILNLVDQFKVLYSKEKNQEFQNSNGVGSVQHKNKRKGTNSNISKRNKNNSQEHSLQLQEQQQQNSEQMQNQIDNEHEHDHDHEHDQQMQQSCLGLKHEYNSEEDGCISDHMFLEKILNGSGGSGGGKRFQKQFTPIITIQRQPSNCNIQSKNSSKKIVMINRTQDKQKQKQKQKLQQKQKQKPQQKQKPRHNNNKHSKQKSLTLTNQHSPQIKCQPQKYIRTLSFCQQDQYQNELMPIQEPSLSMSMSMHQNYNSLEDLIIIGKHIDAKECKVSEEQFRQMQNQCQIEIDEILYENYQQM